MRVVHIGNIANSGYLLCAGLAKLGQEAEFWQQYPPSRPAELGLIMRDTFYGFRPGNPYNVPIHVFNRGAATLEEYLKWLIRTSRKAPPIDILHVHGPYPPEMQLVRLMKRAKMVLHFHGSELRSWSSLIGIYQYVPLLLAREDIALASTPELLPLWKRRILWFKSVIDPLFFERTEMPDHSRIFAPVLFNDTKGWQKIILSWRILRELDSSVSLRLIMGGRHLERAKAMIAGDKRVTWLPLLTRRQIANEMARASVIWGQQNIYGVLGNTELEALASGKPVIATFEPRRYPENYIPPLVPATDPQKITLCTMSLLHDSALRRRIGDKSRAWAKSEHGLEVLAERLLSIYNSLLI
jgi:hypothetical protein